VRTRPSARLLLIDPQDRLLLFRFAHRQGALAGQIYWATPGGGLEPGESFEQAALRELAEETGFEAGEIGPEIGGREFTLRLPSGEDVLADERFFALRIEGEPSRAGWTAQERHVMQERWSLEALMATSETVFPENLPDLLRAALRQ